ncbi:MAG: peroxiredoxin [Chromatiales bacterium]|jgi:peroxiredoxin
MIKPGDKAPEFELPDADMTMVKSSDCDGYNYIVYFYPKNDTPGCTIEATEFSDLMPEFEALDTRIVGVSKDTCVSHGNFRDKYGLTIRLLADVDGQMCEAFGVWQEKEKNGEKRMGIVRSTFVIDKQGVVRYASYDVKPKGHAQEMLELIKAL